MDIALGVIPCKRLSSNQVFTLAAIMAHNFSRGMQMVAHPVATRAKSKCSRLGNLKNWIQFGIRLFKELSA